MCAGERYQGRELKGQGGFGDGVGLGLRLGSGAVRRWPEAAQGPITRTTRRENEEAGTRRAHALRCLATLQSVPKWLLDLRRFLTGKRKSQRQRERGGAEGCSAGSHPGAGGTEPAPAGWIAS